MIKPIITTFLILIFNHISFSQENSKIKYDGIYRYVNEESMFGVAENIRFYDDGTLIKEITAGKGEYKDASHFNKTNNTTIIQYEINGDEVSFEIETRDSAIMYYKGDVNKKEITFYIKHYKSDNELIKEEESKKYLYTKVSGLD